jgi:hypothetical protein
MSKQIDWNAPVSDEDKKWAEQFPALHGGMLDTNVSQFPQESEETLDGEDDEDVPYTEWTVLELQNEVRRRNAEQSKTLPVPSKKADLVRTLEDDDEASEATPV